MLKSVFIPREAILHAALRQPAAREAIDLGFCLCTNGIDNMLLPAPLPGWSKVAVKLKEKRPGGRAMRRVTAIIESAKKTFAHLRKLGAEYRRLRAKGINRYHAADLALFYVPLPWRALGAASLGVLIALVTYLVTKAFA